MQYNPFFVVYIGERRKENDKQEVVVTPSGPLDDQKSTKVLEEQYIDSVVDD